MRKELKESKEIQVNYFCKSLSFYYYFVSISGVNGIKGAEGVKGPDGIKGWFFRLCSNPI